MKKSRNLTIYSQIRIQRDDLEQKIIEWMHLGIC